MAKILNLDKLVPQAEIRELSVGGVSHPILEMTVKNFIETTKAAQALEAETDVVKQLEATIALILRFVPSIGREALDAFSLERLAQIVAFVRGEDLDAAQAAAVSQTEAAGK
ncbi:hypothetical protein LP414_27820 [Polaromonas sp. P1(28)-13]|nr:hypothetical protein LP414_27820 [Polaromonas sp. P1(28)-13]